MTNFPSPMAVPGPESLAPSRLQVQPVQDTSGQDIARGVSGLAQGIAQGAQGLDQVATRMKQQEDTVDIARAEAFKTQKFYDIQNKFSQDPNYATFNERATPEVGGAVEKAASLIRDDRVRERWLAQTEDSKISMLQSIHEHGMGLKQNAEKAALTGSMDENAKLMSDPSVPKAVRDKARSDIEGTLYMGEHTGLLQPTEVQSLRKSVLEAADNQLSLNLAQTDILMNPQRVMSGMAIPTSGAGNSILDAQTAVDGTVAPLEFSMAKMTAQMMHDANFPDDPKLAAAYLSDPQKAMDYAEAAQMHLSDRYKGDLGAVVIAMDPNGGTAVADRWVASGHKDYVLPGAVTDRYHKVMASITAEQPYQRIPIEPAPGVDLGTIDAGVLDRYEQLQSHFGTALPVINGDPSKHQGAASIDVDVSSLNTEQRAKLIEMASSMGFNGIGVGKDTLSLDTGALRAWGPDGKAESVPGWAKDAIDQHNAGTVQPVPSLYSGVAPEYANLTYDQRLTIYARAKAELNNRDVGMRTSLSTIADNAPAAVAQTGQWAGDLPTANDFVKAYGGAEGIQKYQAFESDMDTSKTLFGMRTMSNDQIAAAVKSSVPVSGGNTSAIDGKRYQVISQAADSVLKARATDPAGYTMDAFPQVGDAFKAAGEDHTLFPQALTMMAEAQKKLGITQPELLPKAMASQAADAFKDQTLPAQQRISSVAGLVLATSDVGQQDQIFNQLVKEGLPPMLSGALDAMRRGDAGGSQNLMRAALFDSAKMKTNLPAEQSPDKIQSALQEKVFAAGQIGDIVYGVTGASTDSLDQATGASQLMFNDVTLHLTDGSAGGDLDKAIELSKKDMFGDVQVLTGNGGSFMGMGAGTGVKVTIPKDADPNAARAGFNALTPHVRDQMEAFARQAGGGWTSGATHGALLAMQWSLQTYADAVMSEGYFTNGDGFLPPGQKGFVFYNPKDNAPVYGPDNKPVIFTMAEVLGAGNTTPKGGGF